MATQQPHWFNNCLDGLDGSPLHLTNDVQMNTGDSCTGGYVVPCMYCTWMGQVCLCHSIFSSWPGYDAWSMDVGAERSEMGEHETQCDGKDTKWSLVWYKELALGVEARRIDLHVEGELTAVAEGWTSKEIEARRRVVNVQVSPASPSITVSIAGKDREGIVISCIWWQEKTECFATCTDVMRLLEPLLGLGKSNRKGKTRIRRSMDFFKPFVVSESKNQEFFRLITNLETPHPWKMKKSLSVLPWRFLEPALRRILEDYRAVDKSAESFGSHAEFSSLNGQTQ